MLRWRAGRYPRRWTSSSGRGASLLANCRKCSAWKRRRRFELARLQRAVPARIRESSRTGESGACSRIGWPHVRGDETAIDERLVTPSRDSIGRDRSLVQAHPPIRAKHRRQRPTSTGRNRCEAGSQQLVTPGDGVAHRLAPEREVAVSTGQQRQAAVQPLRAGLAPARCAGARRPIRSPDGKSIQPPANLGDRRSSDPTTANCGSTGRARSAKSWIASLARSCSKGALGSGKASGGTAISCSLETRNRTRLVTNTVRSGQAAVELRHERRGVDDLLQIVEHQQELT